MNFRNAMRRKSGYYNDAACWYGNYCLQKVCFDKENYNDNNNLGKGLKKRGPLMKAWMIFGEKK